MSGDNTTPGWPLAMAQKYAEHIKRELSGLCEKIDIAGSVRRQREFCHDIDLVLLLKPNCRGALESRVRQRANVHVIKSGEQIMAFLLHNGMQVDLYFATPKEDTLYGPIPTNYGMRLLAMTGSKEHNIKLAALAKQQGIHFHPYKGLMRGGEYRSDEAGKETYEGGEVFCGEFEPAIFTALGLDYVKPEHRETEAFFPTPATPVDSAHE